MLDAWAALENSVCPDSGHLGHLCKAIRSSKYEFAVSVTGNWRITFEFEGDDATNVNLEDYH